MHELLRLAGHDALLVRGALEDSAARRLATTVRVPDNARAGDEAADPADDQQLASVLAGSGIGIDEVDWAADEHAARYAEIESEGGSWASAQADTLVEKVAEHVSFADDETDAHAALADHWRVRLPSPRCPTRRPIGWGQVTVEHVLLFANILGVINCWDRLGDEDASPRRHTVNYLCALSGSYRVMGAFTQEKTTEFRILGGGYRRLSAAPRLRRSTLRERALIP